MKKLLFISLIFVFGLACKKKVVPDKEFLIGTWVEKYSGNITFQFTADDTLFLSYKTSTDTSFYWLEEDRKVLHTQNIHSPWGSTHSKTKMMYERKSGNLILWGLDAAPPEAPEMETFFEKRD